MSPSEFRVLIEELKYILKSRDMTYRDLADACGISEAGVKRIFGGKDGKISTLSRVCNALGFSFIDLVNSSKVSKKKVTFFTDEQDRYLAENFDLYVFFNELGVRKKPLRMIKAEHDLSDPVAERYLLRLERLGIIRRTASGQVRVLLQAPIGIRNGGPLRKKLQERFTRGLISNALSSSAGEGSRLDTREWTMTANNIDRFREDLSKLIESYDQISARDESVLSPGELTTLSMMTCLLEASPYGSVLKNKAQR